MFKNIKSNQFFLKSLIFMAQKYGWIWPQNVDDKKLAILTKIDEILAKLLNFFFKLHFYF